MKLKTTIAAASLLMVTSVPMVHAADYTITAIFDEPASAFPTTQFDGTFTFDGTAISNLTGTMNESMYNAGGTAALNFTYNQDTLTGGQIVNETIGGYLTASVFDIDSTDVYFGGGYKDGGTGMAVGSYAKYGSTGMMSDGNVANENAFFTLAIDPNNVVGTFTIADDTMLVETMQYGDCAPGGLMGPMMTGNMCMAGESTELSMMAGTPISFTISEVSAVPVPAAAWLFGGALMSLFGANRRKNVLPA